MIEIIIILLIFAASYFLILKNFDRSVYLLMILSVLLHKELFSFYRWDLMPIRAFMLAMLCAIVTKIYLHYIKNRNLSAFVHKLKDPVFLSLFALWLIRGISMFFSKNLQASLLVFAFFTTIVFLAGYLYLKLKDSPDEVLKFLKFYIYIVFGMTVFGYVQLLVLRFTGVTIGALWTIPGNIPRVGATFWDVNHYGALLAALIPVLGVLTIVDKGIKLKLFRAAMLLSMLFSLFLTNSRSAWIMAFISLLTFICIFLVRRFGVRGLLYVFLGLVVITIPLLVEYSVKSSPFRAKIKQYFHYRMDSFDSHMLLLTGAVQIFEKYPVIGGGYGSFFEHFSKTRIAPTYFGRDPAALNTRVPAHTIWGEILAETGILGLTAFIVFCLLIILPPLYLGLRSKDKTEFLLGSVLSSVYVGWLAAGIFYSYNSEFFWIIIFLFASWSCGKVIKYISLRNLISFFFWSEKTLIAFLVILSLVLIFSGLSVNHLIPYDEAIYAKISKNMIETGNYLLQNWIPGKVWFEKPPLYMWMMASMMKIFGVGSFAAKVPSAFFGFSLVLLVYFFSKKLFGRFAGFFSAFALLTTVQFLYYSRMAMLDVTAAFFITLALALYYLAKQNSKNIYFILSGLAIGLAVMVKGVVGFLPLPVILFYELYLMVSGQQRISPKLFKDYFMLLFFSCLVFLPWHLEMYKKFGSAFVNNYILYHVWDRATTAIEDKGRPFFWYLIVMKVSMRLWFIALIAAFPLSLFRSFKKDNRFVFLSIWALVVFLFFSVAKSKLVWYIMPIYPVVAVMVGYLFSYLLTFGTRFVKTLNTEFYKISVIFIFVLASLFYLFLNKGLVYTSDLTRPQATLLQLKDEHFGVEKTLYADRIELPLLLFYTEGPFVDIDFNPAKIAKVPTVNYYEALILLTKKGRFSDQIPGYDYKPQIVSENGDWILWFMESRYLVDKNNLGNVQDRLKRINADILLNKTISYEEFDKLKLQEAVLLQRMSSAPN